MEHSIPATTQFNDLPDELVGIIMEHGLHMFDRRSRTVVHDKIRDLLVTHEHASIINERLMEKVSHIHNIFLQYHTFQLMLERSLSSEQLREIRDAPLTDRICMMGMRAQENYDHALAVIVRKINHLADTDVVTQMANIFRCQLQTGINNLTGITTLNLSTCGIILIPDETMQLINLQWLDLSHNQLISIPDSLGQLTNLTYLKLSHNHLTFVPDSLGQLTNLQYLYLENNQLTFVPDSLGQLINALWVNLSHNRLISIPASLGMSKLQLLDLNDNQLTSLPDGLGKLPNLRRLNLSHNQLTPLQSIKRFLQSIQRLLLVCGSY